MLLLVFGVKHILNVRQEWSQLNFIFFRGVTCWNRQPGSPSHWQMTKLTGRIWIHWMVKSNRIKCVHLMVKKQVETLVIHRRETGEDGNPMEPLTRLGVSLRATMARVDARGTAGRSGAASRPQKNGSTRDGTCSHVHPARMWINHQKWCFMDLRESEKFMMKWESNLAEVCNFRGKFADWSQSIP